MLQVIYLYYKTVKLLRQENFVMKKKNFKIIIAALCATISMTVPFFAKATPVSPKAEDVNLPAQVSIINNPFANDNHNIQTSENSAYPSEMNDYTFAHPWGSGSPGIVIESQSYLFCPYAQDNALRTAYTQGFNDAKNHQNPAVLGENTGAQVQKAYNEGYAVTLANHDALNNLEHKTFNDEYLQGVYDQTYKNFTKKIAFFDKIHILVPRECTWTEVQDIYDNVYYENLEEILAELAGVSSLS